MNHKEKGTLTAGNERVLRFLPSFFSSAAARTFGAAFVIAWFATLSAHTAEYQPVLLKTSQTTNIIVLDVFADWHGKDMAEAQSVLMTITCWQGLINRASATKIYLLNFPWRLNWDWFETGKRAKPIAGVTHPSTIPGWKHPAQAALDDGLIPFPQTKAPLDPQKTFPALSYLLRQFSGVVKGKTLCPNEEGTAISGARAAAVNACVFENALPMSVGIDAYLASEGGQFPLTADTRGMDNKQALEWSVKRYMTHPKRNRQLVGFCGGIGSNSPIMNDYFVATHTFCYFLYTASKTEPDPADHEYDVITDTRYYPQGVVHIGPVEGAHAIQRLQKRGHTVVCGFIANASVSASIPTDPSTFTPTKAKAHTLDPNGLYIAWELSDDGDALDVLAHTMYGHLRCDSQLGQVPGGIRVNPYLIDLFPTLYRWFAAQPETDIIASMNDGGASYTPEGQAFWLESYHQYLRQANGSVGIVNFFGTEKQSFLQELNVPFIIAGYLGEAAPSRWSMWDNSAATVHATILSRGKEKDIYPVLTKVLQEAPRRDQPFFVLCRSKETPTVVQARMTRLRAEPFLQRKIYWLKPADLAATAKPWLQKTLGNTTHPH